MWPHLYKQGNAANVAKLNVIIALLRCVPVYTDKVMKVQDISCPLNYVIFDVAPSK